MKNLRKGGMIDSVSRVGNLFVSRKFPEVAQTAPMATASISCCTQWDERATDPICKGNTAGLYALRRLKLSDEMMDPSL